MRPENRYLLRYIVGCGTRKSGRAHENQWLRREIDVLLVLGGVARNRLVAEFRKLDSHFLSGDLVWTVADDRPVTA